MPQTSTQKLLGAIKGKNWAAANEQFAGLMQQKVADRIQVERQSIGASLVKEDDDNPFGKKDDDDKDDKDETKDDSGKTKITVKEKKK